MPRLLMHICCGPCFIAPHQALCAEGAWQIDGFWYNPNIHPYTEYLRRQDTLRA
jgi:predicted adenine nucleotide alpha hydrolase (AANH) superfamily ATPase